MPQRPDLPCADCGRLLWRSSTSLPDGEATCQPCRRLKVKTLILQCQGCGVEFKRTQLQRFCSRRCAGVENGSATRPCEVCGILYRYSYPKQRTCSRTCGVLLRQCVTGTMNVAQISLTPKRVPRGPYQKTSGLLRTTECQRCQAPVEFIGRVGRKPKYCEPCRAVAVHEARSQHHRAESHRQRAIRLGVEYQQINRRSVFKRDEWTCQLCGDHVDPTLRWPDQMCASIDHVIPMALGGGHTSGNVQLAHWLCNVLKSDDPELNFRLDVA